MARDTWTLFFAGTTPCLPKANLTDSHTGTDTSASTLARGIWHLLKDPSKLAILQAELKTALPLSTTPTLGWAKLEKLEYLVTPLPPPTSTTPHRLTHSTENSNQRIAPPVLRRSRQEPTHRPCRRHHALRPSHPRRHRDLHVRLRLPPPRAVLGHIRARRIPS